MKKNLTIFILALLIISIQLSSNSAIAQNPKSIMVLTPGKHSPVIYQMLAAPTH